MVFAVRVLVAAALFGYIVVAVGFFNGFETALLPWTYGCSRPLESLAGVILALSSVVALTSLRDPLQKFYTRLTFVLITAALIIITEARLAKSTAAQFPNNAYTRCTTIRTHLTRNEPAPRIITTALLTTAFALGTLIPPRRRRRGNSTVCQ